MNTVIESAVDPLTAASVGLKIDAAALPAEVVTGVMDGTIPLNDPQTTLALLSLNAVVGVKGQVSKGADGKTAPGSRRYHVRAVPFHCLQGSAVTAPGRQAPESTSRELSVTAWTAGPIAICSPGPSFRCRRHSRQDRKPNMLHGRRCSGPAFTIRASM